MENLGKPRDLTPERSPEGKLKAKPFNFYTDARKVRIRQLIEGTGQESEAQISAQMKSFGSSPLEKFSFMPGVPPGGYRVERPARSLTPTTARLKRDKSGTFKAPDNLSKRMQERPRWQVPTRDKQPEPG